MKGLQVKTITKKKDNSYWAPKDYKDQKTLLIEHIQYIICLAGDKIKKSKSCSSMLHLDLNLGIQNMTCT